MNLPSDILKNVLAPKLSAKELLKLESSSSSPKILDDNIWKALFEREFPEFQHLVTGIADYKELYKLASLFTTVYELEYTGVRATSITNVKKIEFHRTTTLHFYTALTTTGTILIVGELRPQLCFLI